MKITFTLLKAPPKAALQQGQKSFDEQGGSIGRADGNQWVLPDPDKFLSSKHCLISFSQQQFFVTDTSTNGLFLNGASLPIGRNNKVVLGEGDTLDLGEYRLRVGIEAGASIAASPFGNDFSPAAEPAFSGSSEWGSLDGPSASPSFEAEVKASPFAPPINAGADPFALAQDPFAAADPFQKAIDPMGKTADPFAHADPFAKADPFGKADPFAKADPFGKVDPFAKADPFASSPFTTPPADYGFTQGEQGSPLSQAFNLPPLTSDRKGIPDDFWNSLGAADAPPTPPAANQAWAPAADPNPFNAASAIPDDFFTSALGIPQQSPHQPATPPPVPPPAATLKERIEAMQPITPPPHEIPPPMPTANRPEPAVNVMADIQVIPQAIPVVVAPILVAPVTTEAAIQPKNEGEITERPYVSDVEPPKPTPAPPTSTPLTPAAGDLLKALGLEGRLGDAQAAALPDLIGAITRESLNGLLQILRARNSIKNEFRISVTTIQATENNPIKFATDVDDALDLLFVRHSKGYKPPVDSVRDSFESIMDHQVAVLAGIRAAFTALLARFDPVTLENQFERQGKTGGLLPGMKGAKCWGAYDDFYRELMGNFENSFQNLFGDDFVQAYEEQLRKLSIARKLEGRNY